MKKNLMVAILCFVVAGCAREKIDGIFGERLGEKCGTAIRNSCAAIEPAQEYPGFSTKDYHRYTVRVDKGNEIIGLSFHGFWHTGSRIADIDRSHEIVSSIIVKKIREKYGTPDAEVEFLDGSENVKMIWYCSGDRYLSASLGTECDRPDTKTINVYCATEEGLEAEWIEYLKRRSSKGILDAADWTRVKMRMPKKWFKKVKEQVEGRSAGIDI